VAVGDRDGEHEAVGAEERTVRQPFARPPGRDERLKAKCAVIDGDAPFNVTSQTYDARGGARADDFAGAAVIGEGIDEWRCDRGCLPLSRRLGRSHDEQNS
jgi:hypothetical protein